MSSNIKIPKEVLLEICSELGILLPNTTYFGFIDTATFYPINTFTLMSSGIANESIEMEVTGNSKFREVIELWWQEMFKDDGNYVPQRRTVAIIHVNETDEVVSQLIFYNTEPTSSTTDESGFEYECTLTAHYYDKII